MSGHSDVEWKLSGMHVSELISRLGQITNSTSHIPDDFLNRLSYRGLSITSNQQSELAPYIRVHGGIVEYPPFGYPNYSGHLLDSGNSELEKWLINTAGELVPFTVKQNIESELEWLWFSYSQYR